MKRRTVKVRVHLVKGKRADGTEIDHDAIIPSHAEICNYLNSIYGYQINAWFDVSGATDVNGQPVTYSYDWGDEFDTKLGDTTDNHTADQAGVVQAVNDNVAADIQVYILAHLGPLGTQAGAVGSSSAGEKPAGSSEGII